MKTISRRRFLESIAASGGLIQAVVAEHADTSQTPSSTNTTRPSQSHRNAVLIDRRALVGRHSPVIRRFDPLSPLSVGNGEFAFTADITGLQTFPREYEGTMPLCTMSQWGWHTIPLTAGLDSKALRLTDYDTHGRPVGYATSSEGQSEIYTWLRENPHRLHLGQVGLRLLASDGKKPGSQKSRTLNRGLISGRDSLRADSSSKEHRLQSERRFTPRWIFSL